MPARAPTHHPTLQAANDALLEEKHQLRAQVADLEVRAANAAVVMEAGRSQVEGLRGERAQLAGEAARLGDALADAEARLQALARRNGELRWAARVGWRAWLLHS